MLVAFAMAQVTSTSVDALTSQQVTATAMATSLTPWASVVATVQPMRMPMASATTWTNALANLTNAAFAMAQVLYSRAVALRFPKGIAIVMATSLTPWAFAVANAPRTWMPMAFATMWTNALAHQIIVAFATALELSTSAAVLTSQRGIATVMETNWMHWVYVVVLAPPMQMPMAFATMWMNALAH